MESNMKDKKQQAVPQSEAESFGIKRNPAVRAPRRYDLPHLRIPVTTLIKPS